MGRAFEVLGYILFWPVYIYGMYRAFMLFFETQTCAGSACQWVFTDWNPLAWGFLLFMYLPFIPFVGAVLVILYLIPSGVCFWIANRAKR